LRCPLAPAPATPHRRPVLLRWHAPDDAPSIRRSRCPAWQSASSACVNHNLQSSCARLLSSQPWFARAAPSLPGGGEPTRLSNQPHLFRASLTGIGRWSSLAGCDGPSGCLPAAFEIPTSPTSWPRATSRRSGLAPACEVKCSGSPDFIGVRDILFCAL